LPPGPSERFEPLASSTVWVVSSASLKVNLTLEEASFPSDKMKYADAPNTGRLWLLAAVLRGKVVVRQIKNW